jgi:V8-like Glu-specific endopeptidase
MRSRLAALFIPILALSMMPAAVAAAPGDAARAQHEAIVAFWTPERMQSAIPRDITFDAVRGFQPAAPPPGKGPGGGGAGGGGTDPVGDVTGASWTGGGAVMTGIGKVFFVLGASAYQCSASVVTDTRTGHSLALTAAHCAIDKGKFATNWMFIPDYDSAPAGYNNCANTAHGCWTAQALFVHKNYADQKRFNNTAVTHDFAFALLGQGGKTNTLLEDTAGGKFGITFNGTSAGDTLSAFGYPAGAPYDGKDLTYCKGRIGTDPNTSNQTWSMVCDMTGGSSGGGWLAGDPTQFAASLNSLNSYGYSGVNNMYGPMLNSRAQAVYNAANGSATTNKIVTGG